jgi:hypothetical protein
MTRGTCPVCYCPVIDGECACTSDTTRQAKEAVNTEREACAKIAEAYTKPSMDSNSCCEYTAQRIMNAIRARSTP